MKKLDPRASWRKRKKLAAPKGLGPEARAWWRRLREDYGIEDEGGLSTLELGARAFDRMTEAAKLIDTEGCVMKDRWGQSKPHPAAVVERDSRAAVLACLRALHLDVEPLKEARGGRR